MPVDLPETLRLHALWLRTHPGGKRANLRGADLRGASLNDSNLGGADLRDANLRDANLRGADLRDAYLNGANLRGASLNDANLGGADLRDANLRDANLRGASLNDANLGGANLNGAVGLPIASDSQERLKAVAQQVLDQPDHLDMTNWHSKCGTTHCLAGWAIQQAGPVGEILEKLHGSHLAGLLLLGTEAANHFYDSKLDVIPWLASIAHQEA
jgi:hypothetical protein